MSFAKISNRDAQGYPCRHRNTTDADLLQRQLVDRHTLYAADARRGAVELVSRSPLTNVNTTVSPDGYFDFAEHGSVLDFPVAADAKWQLNDFTIELVYTFRQYVIAYPTLLATSTAWVGGCIACRCDTGHARNRTSFYWNGLGDPLLVSNADIPRDNQVFRHYALSRSGSSLVLFDNGTEVARCTANAVLNCCIGGHAVIRLGSQNPAEGDYNGKIKWARISNICRYTENFSPTV